MRVGCERKACRPVSVRCAVASPRLSSLCVIHWRRQDATSTAQHCPLPSFSASCSTRLCYQQCFCVAYSSSGAAGACRTRLRLFPQAYPQLTRHRCRPAARPQLQRGAARCSVHALQRLLCCCGQVQRKQILPQLEEGPRLQSGQDGVGWDVLGGVLCVCDGAGSGVCWCVRWGVSDGMCRGVCSGVCVMVQAASATTSAAAGSAAPAPAPAAPASNRQAAAAASSISAGAPLACSSLPFGACAPASRPWSAVVQRTTGVVWIGMGRAFTKDG